ncbi:hypothetical protein PQX77_002053 [Marasmius sp. AFHP31]|nr:hypothetical protein PQX77_002053 [Marasmius sp. AFHP31]
MEKPEFALPVSRKKSLGGVFSEKDKHGTPSDSPTTPLLPSPRTRQTNITTTTNTEQQQPIVIPSPPSSPTATTLLAPAATATSPVSTRFSTAFRHSTNSISGLGTKLGLTDSRPAPLSPAMSRRASGVCSTRSPEGEREKKGELSPASAGVVAGLVYGHLLYGEEGGRREGTRTEHVVLISDTNRVAFSEGDMKHLGMGKEAPKLNNVGLSN